MAKTTNQTQASPSSELHQTKPSRHFDTSVPHPARVYGYWLGGKDNFPADRRAAKEVMRLRPQVVASALAPGSYLAISHLTGDFAPEQVSAATEAYNTHTHVPVTARSHSQVSALFGGLPLLAPGVVPVTEWRPEVGDPFGQPADLHGGLARIPGLPRPGSWA